MRNGYVWTGELGGGPTPGGVKLREIEQISVRRTRRLEAARDVEPLGHWVVRARNRRHALRQLEARWRATLSLRVQFDERLLAIAREVQPQETPFFDAVVRG